MEQQDVLYDAAEYIETVRPLFLLSLSSHSTSFSSYVRYRLPETKLAGLASYAVARTLY